MSQTSFKITFALSYCWAFTFLCSVILPDLASFSLPLLGLIILQSPYFHTSTIIPQILVLPARFRFMSWNLSAAEGNHTPVSIPPASLQVDAIWPIVHHSTSCSSQHRCHMIAAYKPFSDCYPPALFLSRLPLYCITYYPFVLPPSPVYKHVYAYPSLISFLPNVMASYRSLFQNCFFRVLFHILLPFPSLASASISCFLSGCKPTFISSILRLGGFFSFFYYFFFFF